jgi:starch phosphorylase
MVRRQLGEELLNPDVLTIGFARRFATYKRATLLLSQPDRLVRLLGASDRPVQFVFAGKAHPADVPGKELIRSIDEFTKRSDARHRFVFVPDYDIGIARTMYHGCDVWLNTPRRPMEACGTSGMKAALNGCLNLSIRDGWWDEMTDGSNGFDIVSFDDDPDLARRDRREANATFDLIERDLLPLFYGRGDDGLPHGWIERVIHNWATLGWNVIAGRMVRDYVTELYEPAARSSRQRTEAGADGARRLAAWKATIADRFADVKVTVSVDESELGEGPAGAARTIVADLHCGSLDPGELVAQLVGAPIDARGELDDRRREVTEMVRGDDGRYRGKLVPSDTGRWGMVVRVLPTHSGLAGVYDTGLMAIG